MNYFLTIIILIFAGSIAGSLLGIIKKPTARMLCGFLSFAGGMMVFISLIHLLPESIKLTNWAISIVAVIVGALLIWLIDKSLPHINPELAKKEKPNIKRTAAMLVIGMAIHNLPEGLAVSGGFTVIPKLGFLVALSIALHDIPEAIATVVPVFAASGKRLKSFLISSTVVAFEFVGFLAGYFIFKNISPLALGIALALTAGIMMYLSFEELFPCAKMRKYPVISTLAVLLSFIFVLITRFLL